MLTYADLMNNALLDPNFPYPMAFETCYNIAVQLIDLMEKGINLIFFMILFFFIGFVMRCVFSFMK